MNHRHAFFAGDDVGPGSPLLDTIFAAHGGLQRWRAISALEVLMSARGLLFTSKRLRPLDHQVLIIDPQAPHTRLTDFPEQGQDAMLHGNDSTEIVARDGSVSMLRQHPRAAFAGLRRFFYWDPLDFVYFCSYAMWNYLTLPYLLARDDIQVDEIAPKAGYAHSLRVQFPQRLPTHCPVQHLHFDADHHLRRHDYTALVVGRWANAAHFCDAYRTFDGLAIPTRRRVHPVVLGKPLPAFTLVAIDIHGVHATSAQS